VHADRHKGRSESRILYWFHTPPGVKIGRTPLDEETTQLLEQLNPDVEFDWPRIRKGQGVPPVEPRPPVELRRQRQPDPRNRGGKGRTEGPPRREPAGPRDVTPPPAPPPSETIATRAEGDAVEERPQARPEALQPPPISAADLAEAAATPAGERLGPQGVHQLRARYADIIARLAERGPEAERQEEMRAAADRLNPDSWTSADEVTRGLEEYEAVLASLREVVGRRKRRRRRGPRSGAEPSAAGPQGAEPAEPDPADAAEAGEPDDGESGSGGA
jgi:hypothetical protein